MQLIYKIWLMPMSFKTIFCISQLFYNSPFFYIVYVCMMQIGFLYLLSPAHRKRFFMAVRSPAGA